MKKLLILLLTTAFLFQSCGNGTEKKTTETPQKTTTEAVEKDSIQRNIQDVKQGIQDTIILSKKHKPNSISCDLDGDRLSDKVEIVQNTNNKKYGLKITFGNKKVEYLEWEKRF